MSAAVAPLDQFFAQLMRAQSFRARAREAAESFGTPKKRKNAMNSLTKIETKNELAPLELSDPFIEYADAIAPQFIVGDLLEFSKGDYLAGQNNTLVPMGTVFTVNMDELMAGWVRWWDGKPTDHVMVRVANRAVPNKPPGDDDETKWETDASGEPRNPWALTNYVPMMNEKGELFHLYDRLEGRPRRDRPPVAALWHQRARTHRVLPRSFWFDTRRKRLLSSKRQYVMV
jgi:hypothetical protein